MYLISEWMGRRVLWCVNGLITKLLLLLQMLKVSILPIWSNGMTAKKKKNTLRFPALVSLRHIMKIWVDLTNLTCCWPCTEPLKTRQWYKRFFFRLLDLCMVTRGFCTGSADMNVKFNWPCLNLMLLRLSSSLRKCFTAHSAVQSPCVIANQVCQ